MRFAAMMAWLLAMVLAPGAAAQPLTVMSFNIRYPGEGDGANLWEKRRALAIETIREAAPDLIGTQELFQRQGDDIVRALPEYRWFGTDRRGGHADEHMGVFYRKDRLRLIGQGEFWLSETPEVPGSNSWGHPFPRMVTWGLFETRAGRRFKLYNTHFPYRGEDEPAREKAARLIAARIAAEPADLPVVLTGDFNTGPASTAHRILTEGLTDTWDAAPNAGPTGYHGFTGKPGARIDWILARGMTITRTYTIDAHEGPIWPSDHFPVVAKLTLSPR